MWQQNISKINYNIYRIVNLLVLIQFVIQFTIQVMNKTQMKVLSWDDGGLWMELSQGGDRRRTGTVVVLQLLFCYQQVSLVLL